MWKMRAIIAVGSLSAGLCIGQDSPCFRGPEHNGTYPKAVIRTDWQAKPPKILWKKDVGFGFSQVVVVGKDALTCGYDPDKDCSTLFWFDAETGAEKRKVEYKDSFGGQRSSLVGPVPTPAIDDGKVYVVAAMGVLYCFDLASGAKLWEKITNKDAPAGKFGDYGDCVSPVIVNDMVIAQLTVGQDGAAWHAFKKKDGAPVWSHPMAARKSTKKAEHIDRAYSPAVSFINQGKGRLILVSNANIDCVNTDDGKPAWSVDHSDLRMEWGPFPEPIVFDNDKFLLGCWYGGRATAFVYQMAADSATEVWANKTLGKACYSYVVAGGHAYGYGIKGFQCVDLKDGKVKWQWRDEEKGTKDQGETIVVGDKLVWLTTSGRLYAGDVSPEKLGGIADVQVIGPCAKDMKKVKSKYNDIVCVSPSCASGRIYCRAPWGETVCVDVSK